MSTLDERSLDSYCKLLSIKEREYKDEYVRQAFQQLPALERTCLLLQIEGEFAVEDITDIVDESQETVAVAIHDAREHVYQYYHELIEQKGKYSIFLRMQLLPNSLTKKALRQLALPHSDRYEQRTAPVQFPQLHREDPQVAIKRRPRLQSPWWLVAACLIIAVLVPQVRQFAFPIAPHDVRASSLSLQQSLQEIDSPPGGTFVHTVSWSPNGKYIAVLWDVSILQIREAQDHYPVIFSQKVGWRYGLAWSYDSYFLAYPGSEENTIQIWNSSTRQSMATSYRGHSAQVEAIAWSPDGNYIASASDDHTVQIWNTHTMQRLYTHRDSGTTAKALAWSPDGRRLVMGDDNNHVLTWDARTGDHIVSYPGHTGAITFVGWSLDGNFILSSSYDGAVLGWDVKTGRIILKFSLPDSNYSNHSSPIFAADCSWNASNGAYLALVTNYSVHIWYLSAQQGKIEPHEVTTTSVAHRIAHKPERGQFDNITSISWSHTRGQLIAGGSGDVLNFQLA